MAKYNYTYHEERGEFHGYVEDSNGKTIWEVHYPDFYEDEETGELVESSTIFEDGFMKYQNDTDGLEKYLKSIGILKANDEIVDNEDYADGGNVEQGNIDMVKNQVIQVEHHAKELMETLKSNPQVDAWVVAKMDRATSNLSDITHYLEGENKSFADGGETDSNTFEKVKVTIRDVDMGGDVAYKGDHWFRKDQLAKKTNQEIGDYILRKYGLDYGNTYKYSITRTGETKQKMARGGSTPQYETYHETLASVLNEAERYIESKGYKFIDEQYYPDVTSGGIRYGVTQRLTRQVEEVGGKKRQNTLILTIYRMDSGRYELVMYLARLGYASGGALENKLKKRLSESFELPMEMAVYVPSTDKANIIISKKDYANRIEEVESYLSDLFGGYSAVSVDGGYISSDKGLIQEDVTRVATFGSTEQFESKFTKLINKIVDWCNKWGQESMGFEFEGDMFYIDKKASFKHGGEVITK